MGKTQDPLNSLKRSARLAIAFDFWILVGGFASVTALGSRHSHWSPFAHLLLPAFLLPFLLFLSHRFLGTTPGQYLYGVSLALPNGNRATRFYDWIFNLRPKTSVRPPSILNCVIAIIGAFVFTVGSTFYLWMRDPTLRPLSDLTLPLFAPSKEDERRWQTLPFFYATGTFPIRFQNDLSVEFSLPYEKGPPTRFLGKILVYWRDFDSRLTLTGPLTVASPATPEELRGCMEHWFRCLGDRRRIWKNSVAPSLAGRMISEASWFTNENPFLSKEERPQGIYVRTVADRGRVREAYFLVGPKMAIQGLVLDRPDRPEGELASETLRKVIGSFRLSGDLQAPRAFINPKLAALRIGPKSTLSELVGAEGYLLAKVSIEPQDAESFYHLGGLALTLFHSAKREGRIELAASSKTIVKSATQFARDVQPGSHRIPEMERFAAEVETP